MRLPLWPTIVAVTISLALLIVGTILDWHPLIAAVGMLAGNALGFRSGWKSRNREL